MIKVKKISRAEFIEKTRQPHRRYFINVKALVYFVGLRILKYLRTYNIKKLLTIINK